MSMTEPHTIILRLHRTDPDGTSVVEEREIQCSEAQIAKLMHAPWDTAPVDKQNEGESAQKLLDTLQSTLSKLTFTIREKRKRNGETVWMVRLGPIPDVLEEVPDEAHPEPRNTVCVSGDVKVITTTDDFAAEDGSLRATTRGSAINVTNKGLSIVNCGNVYAIVNIELTININREQSMGQ